MTKKILAFLALILLIQLAMCLYQEQRERREPPCEELIWMRDAPQARCVEYWKKRNAEEGRYE